MVLHSYLLVGNASLFTEKELTHVYSFDEVDILKVGYYGSKPSIEEVFLNLVNSKVALISSGKNNHFSHSHKEVVTRFQEHSISIFSTQNDGSIVIGFRKKGNILKIIP